MPKKPREPRRKRLAAVAPPAPLIQVMSGARGRLDPTAIRELTAWVVAYSRRYVSTATKTLRGLKGEERKLTLAKRKAAEAAITMLRQFVEGLTDTIDIRLIDAALSEWDGYLNPDPNAILPFVTPPIPGLT